MLDVHGLQQRSALLQAVRSFFIERNCLEVDTPIRLPTLLPEANILPFPSDGWFLQPSPEQCMKRLLARGCRHIFQICHCFRREESGRLHQPEFTMLEWYRSGWDYTGLMRECEQLLNALATAGLDLPGVAPGPAIRRGGCLVDLAPPWERLTVAEAFHRYAGIAVRDALAAGDFDEVLVTLVEPHLGCERPVFLYDYPVELGSLARKSAADPSVAERFELYIAGIEIANGFSELVDPNEQRHRFTGEIAAIRGRGDTAAMPEPFLADLERLGDMAGIALGLDRLFMLLQGCATLDEAQTFSCSEL